MIDGTDEMIERAAAELRAPVHLDATFDERVMRAVRAARVEGARPAGSAWAWLTRPRPLNVSPLAGLAYAAALVLAVGTIALRVIAPQTSSPTERVAANAAEGASITSLASAGGEGTITVTFMLRAPSASQVVLVGDFNDWSPTATPLRRAAGDVWAVTVPLVRGRYTYNFVLDGRDWVLDPSAPRAAGDDFGRPSSVVMVAGT